jgi:hypothetical protein
MKVFSRNEGRLWKFMMVLACVFAVLAIAEGAITDHFTKGHGITAIRQIALAQTGPVIEMEKELEIKTPRLASITIKSTAKDLWWEMIPPGDFDAFREYDPDTSKIKLRLMPYTNGTFYLVVGGAAGDKASASKCKITVSAFGPSPGPNPPGPGPLPPPPNDPLLMKLQAAYGSNTDPQKLVHKAQLSSLYTYGAKLLQNDLLNEWGNIYQGMADKAKELGVAGKLAEVQGILAVELKGTLPTKSDVALTAANRQTGIALFTRISSLLDQVK